MVETTCGSVYVIVIGLDTLTMMVCKQIQAFRIKANMLKRLIVDDTQSMNSQIT